MLCISVIVRVCVCVGLRLHVKAPGWREWRWSVPSRICFAIVMVHMIVIKDHVMCEWHCACAVVGVTGMLVIDDVFVCVSWTCGCDLWALGQWQRLVYHVMATESTTCPVGVRTRWPRVPWQQDPGPHWPDDANYMATFHRLAEEAPLWLRAPKVEQLQALTHALAQATEAREAAQRAKRREQQMLLDHYKVYVSALRYVCDCLQISKVKLKSDKGG